MTRLVFLLTMGTCAMALSACGGPGAETQYRIGGVAQKGPLVLGATVVVSELTATLDATGRGFDTTTVDELGTFSLSVQLAGGRVEVRAEGYYFDEVQGQLSDGPLTLRGISSLGSGPDVSVNVNVLTHLARDRVRALVAGGLSLAAALDQSRHEVLAAFNMDIDGIDAGAFDGLQLAGPTEGDAMLVAVSAVVQQGAVTRAAGGPVTAELSRLLAQLAADLAPDGRVDDAGLLAELRASAMQLDAAAVRAQLEEYYAAQGVAVAVPPFERYVDADGDGFVPAAEELPDPFGLGAVTDALPGAVVESNEITVSGVVGVAPVALSTGTLIQNGTALDTLTTDAVTGDRLRVRLTAPAGFGETANAHLRIGRTNGSFTVQTFALAEYAFTLTPVTDASVRFVPALSETLTITGLTVPYLPVSVVGGTLLKNGMDLGETSTTLTEGDTVQVKVIPSTASGGKVTATLTIGLTTGTFTVTSTAPWQVVGAPPAPTPYADCAQCSAVIGGRLYQIVNGTSGQPDTLVAYDPATASWSAKATVPQPVSRMSVAVVDTKLYAIGGFASYGGCGNCVRIYDSTADTWTLGTPMPSSRNNMGTGVIDGKVYVAAGGLAMTPQSTLEVYDPVANSWVTRASAPTARFPGFTTAVNGLLYVMGRRYNGANPENCDLVEVYDPGTDTWQARAPFPGCDSSSLGYDELVAGGVRNGSILAVRVSPAVNSTRYMEVFTYDPVTDTWVPDPSYSWGFPAVRPAGNGVIGGRLYLTGGSASGRILVYDDALDF
jgi:hypothetical protein